MIDNNIRAGLVIFSANNSGFYSVAGNDVVAFDRLQQIPTDVIFISNSKSAIIGFSNIKKTNFFGTSIQTLIKAKGLKFSTHLVSQAKDLAKLLSNIVQSFASLSGSSIDDIMNADYASDIFVKIFNNSDISKKFKSDSPSGNLTMLPMLSNHIPEDNKGFSASFDILKHSRYMFSNRIPTGEWKPEKISGMLDNDLPKFLSQDKFKKRVFVFKVTITHIPSEFYKVLDLSLNNPTITLSGHAVRFLIKNKYKFKIVDAWSANSVYISTIATKYLSFSIPKTSNIFIPSDIIGYMAVSVWKSIIFLKNTDNSFIEIWLNDWNNIVMLNSTISSSIYKTNSINKISNNNITIIANKKTAPVLSKKIIQSGLISNPDLFSFIQTDL